MALDHVVESPVQAIQGAIQGAAVLPASLPPAQNNSGSLQSFMPCPCFSPQLTFLLIAHSHCHKEQENLLCAKHILVPLLVLREKLFPWERVLKLTSQGQKKL